jgi:hypothetical protein
MAMKLTLFVGSSAITGLLLFGFGAPPAAILTGVALAGVWSAFKARA